MGFFDKLSATAISLVVSGNTGVSPFLTLFIVGCMEKSNPDLLQMDEAMESLLASWPSLIFLGICSVLEFMSMCIPVVDEIVDSIMTVVIPIMSILGSLSTFGLLANVAEGYEFDEGEGGRRQLGAASSALWVFQIILIVVGIVLALSMHMFKMLVRLIGEGWLTNILTVIEGFYVISTVTMAVFIKPIAIFVAFCIVMVCAYNIKRKYFGEKNEIESLSESEMASHSEDNIATESSDPEVGGSDYVSMQETR